MQKTVKLYNNSVTLHFSDNARNRYTIEETGSSPVGVTTVLGLLNKPALLTWPMWEALTYIKTVDGVITKEHIEIASQAYLKKSDTGKSTGTAVHKAIEQLLLGKDYRVPPEAARAVLGFQKWAQEHHPMPLEVELIVYSKTHNYAGTLDGIMGLNGKFVLFDLKTNNASQTAPLGIYAEMYLQLGAYSLAYKEQSAGKLIQDLAIIRVGKDGIVNTLRASELGLSVPDCEQAWLSVLAAYRFLTPLTKTLKEQTYEQRPISGRPTGSRHQ